MRDADRSIRCTIVVPASCGVLVPESPLLQLLKLSSIPTEMWGLIGVCLLASTMVSFITGIWYARTFARSAEHDRVRRFNECFDIFLQKLDSAESAGKALEDFTRPGITAEGLEQLNSRRTSLMITLGRVAESLSGVVTTRPKSRAARHIVWIEGPECPRTGLPDDTAFQQNLNELVDSLEGREAGLLLVRVERFDGLRQRFGDVGATGLLRTVGKLVVCAIREHDYLARADTRTLAVLFPDTDRHTGVQIAESIRAAVRAHRFCLEESGVEVLVTASLGYAVIQQGDRPDLVLNRAATALAEAERQGRNQLRIHAQNVVVERLTA